MKRIFLMGFLLLGVLGFQAIGQVRTITGTVTDAGDGSTLPGVSIMVKGTTQGTVTDINGQYQLNASGDAVLVFSFIGMTTQEVAVSGRNVINVALEADVRSLHEVVVVGYGTARSVGTVVGSIATVSSEKLESKPVANVWDAMQGRVAGLQVYTSTGEPSQTSSVRLHGVGSLSASATPLYVIDGAPIAAANVLSINPNDIETVTVLKDASATSIYGSRAANGVIYITTKSGIRDQNARVTVNSQYGISNLANEDYFNRMMTTDQLLGFWQEVGYRTPAQIETIRTNFPNDTRWHKYYYKQDVPTYQGDISIQGGGGRTTYYVSGSYFFQDGVAAHSVFERYNMRANLNSSANDWLSFGTNLTIGTNHRQLNPHDRNSTHRGLAMLAQPFYTPYDADGKRFEGFIPGWGRVDPFYRAEKNPRWSDQITGAISTHMQLNPIEGLTIRVQGGLDAYDDRTTDLTYPSYVEAGGSGYVDEEFTRYITRSITNTAEYKFNINRRHEFTVLGGHEYMDNTFTQYAAISQGQTDDRLMLLTAGPSSRSVRHVKHEHAYNSYFARADYGLDKKYFLDLSVRQDASSRFGRENSKANFWAAGAMWNLKRESFLANNNFITSMNLRASVGTSGNSEFSTAWSTLNYGHLATVATTLYGGGTGWIISGPGNPNLTWENQFKGSIGTNLVLADRYRINLEYYDRRTTDMLLSVPQPYTSGFANINENVGAMQNRGIDLEFSFDATRSRDFYFTPYVNFSYNKNKVTELFQGLEFWMIPNTGVAWAIGQPVAFYYPIFAGIDPADGKPMWYVPGDDISVTTKGETTKVFNEAALMQNTGIQRYAPVTGGFGLSTGYKGIGLQLDFSYVSGKYLLNNDRYFFENPSTFPGFNQSSTILDYWKKEGDVTRFPAYGTQFTQFDSRLIENASFMRLKNAMVSYQLPAALVQRTGIMKGSRIFVQGRNLLTFTKYEGPDPEHDINLSLGVNPNTRQYAVGITLNF